MLPKFLRTSIFFVSFFAFVCLHYLLILLILCQEESQAPDSQISGYVNPLVSRLLFAAPFLCWNMLDSPHYLVVPLVSPTLLVEFLEFVMHMIHHMMHFLDFILYETVCI